MSGYISNTGADTQEMLDSIGIKSTEQLFDEIPEEVRYCGIPDNSGQTEKTELGGIPGPMADMQTESYIKNLAARNKSAEKLICFLGAGIYDHYIPPVVRHMISRQEFYTSYTPYQPEISQGMLQAIFEYQSMMCSLTGGEVCNASLYDGASALAEAASMACRATGRNEVAVLCSVNPEYRKVLKTYAHSGGWTVKELLPAICSENDAIKRYEAQIDPGIAALIIQSPDFFGYIEDIKAAAEAAHSSGALLIVTADPLSLAVLEAPGVLGADIITGEGQALGNPMSFGGPHFGFMTASEKLLRKMPGRIVGQTKDKNGKRCFVLTMQAREQHIRREKATSNICSNQALNALAAAVYMTAAGKSGLPETAQLCYHKAVYAYNKLLETGLFKPLTDRPFFKEFALESSIEIQKLNAVLLENGILGGCDAGRYYMEHKNVWILAVTEKRTREEIDYLAGIISDNFGNKSGVVFP